MERDVFSIFNYLAKHIIDQSISISEVIDISPSNLDSSLCFFQSSVSHLDESERGE